MIKKVKKIFKTACWKFGFEIQILKTKTTKIEPISIKIGDFKIECLTNNGLIYCFENCNEYGKVLSRVVKQYFENYSSLKVIDIGANIGDTICLIKTDGDVPVLAIEGDSSILKLLKKNILQFNEIQIVDQFLSDNVEDIVVSTEKESHNMTLVPTKNGQIVKFTTIDSLFVNRIITENHKIIKVDTEGFDLKILRGGLQYLKTVNPIIYFEYNLHCLLNIEKNPENFIEELVKIGYCKFLIYESDGNFLFTINENTITIFKELDGYLRLLKSKIYYIDILAFNKIDLEFAENFQCIESQNRIKNQ